MYIAVMNIKSSRKTYKKGDVLGKEFSDDDIKRFLKAGAVFSRGESYFDEIEEFQEPVFLEEESLRKMKTKADLVDYGKSIGVDISNEITKEEMINALLNYIEEAENSDI